MNPYLRHQSPHSHGERGPAKICDSLYVQGVPALPGGVGAVSTRQGAWVEIPKEDHQDGSVANRTVRTRGSGVDRSMRKLF